MTTIKLLYFASLADKLGASEETLALPPLVTNISELKIFLAERGDNWQEVMAARSIKCAVNQVLADTHSEIKDGCEIAFFPPMTGG